MAQAMGISMELIRPGRVNLGKATVRVFREDELKLLKRVKDLTDSGIILRTAFEWARENEVGDSESCGD
jgi:hypothetical protein